MQTVKTFRFCSKNRVLTKIVDIHKSLLLKDLTIVSTLILSKFRTEKCVCALQKMLR